MKKRLFAVLMSIAFLATSVGIIGENKVSAESPTAKFTERALSKYADLSLSKFKNDPIANLEMSKSSIYSLSNSDFDKFIVDYVNEHNAKGYSNHQISEQLKSIDIELGFEKKFQTMASGDLPSHMEVTLISASRGTEIFTRLIGSVVFEKGVYRGGSLDLLSIEWDPRYANYYSYATDDNFTSLQDYSKRSQGILLFNVEDVRASSGDSTYGAAYVTFGDVDGIDVDVAAKFTHTWDDTSINWKIGSNLSYEAKSPQGGFTFEISSPTSENIKNWTKISPNVLEF